MCAGPYTVLRQKCEVCMLLLLLMLQVISSNKLHVHYMYIYCLYNILDSRAVHES